MCMYIGSSEVRERKEIERRREREGERKRKMDGEYDIFIFFKILSSEELNKIIKKRLWLFSVIAT